MKVDSIFHEVAFPEARNHYLEVHAHYPVQELEEVELLIARRQKLINLSGC